jgi:NADH:ubiquinone oxidoreductase subunit 2 (subunit N)
VLAVLISFVVGAFYYLRIVKLMYFDEPGRQQTIIAPVDFRAVLTVNGVAVLGPGHLLRRPDQPVRQRFRLIWAWRPDRLPAC